MTALEFCIKLRDEHSAFPRNLEGKKTEPSGSEIKRLIMNGGVEFSGQTIKDPQAEVQFPINSFVVFPNGKRRTTLA